MESCALCGRTILLGERILRLRIDGRRVALCPLCEESMRAQRFERAAWDERPARMNEQQLGPRPRPLSFEEVEAAGLPALFSAFGDLLIYKDGTVHALPSTADPVGLAQPEQLPGAYVVTPRVGIEHPWLHASGCPCRFCAPEADRQVA